MMKYNTEQFVKVINSPIICKFDGQELTFEDGKAMAAYEFDKKTDVISITIEDGKAVVELKERPVPNINYIGEEAIHGDDWIEEHKKKYGVEPNLFDGA